MKKVSVHGPPKLVAAGESFEFLVASPQCPNGEVWDPEAIGAFTDHLIREFPVDPDRIILTGVSLGGFGTWETAIAFPEKYAAIVSICGGAGVRFLLAERLKSVPIWAFHGAKDPVVPVAYSQMMVESVQKAGGQAKITVYAETGHDSWTEAYETPELYIWMLEQKRGGKC